MKGHSLQCEGYGPYNLLAMKKTTSSFFLIGLSMIIISCGATANQTRSNPQNLKDYSQYNNMIEVMQSVRGLVRAGSGADAKVYMSGYNSVNATNKEPLFVVDGVVAGSSLSQLNLILTPVQVKTVRTIRGTQATSRYGDQGLFGVVMITTITSDKKK